MTVIQVMKLRTASQTEASMTVYQGKTILVSNNSHVKIYPKNQITQQLLIEQLKKVANTKNS